MGREHEDLVLATGRLASDVPFHCSVDWLTPTKTRRTRILGERGMLVADTLNGDLTLHENADVPIEWPATQHLRGVSEGDATRFALQRREPLLVEHEAFRAYVAGDDDAPVVEPGLGARDGPHRTGGARQRPPRRDGAGWRPRLEGRRRRPWQGGPAPCRPDRTRRPRGRRLRHRPARRRPRQRGDAAVPERGGPGGGAPRGDRRRAPEGADGHRGGRGGGPRPRRRRPAAPRRRGGAPRLGDPRRRRRRHRARPARAARP